jgi:hypothetical protein
MMRGSVVKGREGSFGVVGWVSEVNQLWVKKQGFGREEGVAETV